MDAEIRSERTGMTEERGSKQEEETDVERKIYFANNCWGLLAGEGSVAWLLSLRSNSMNDTFITLPSCKSHIHCYALL